MPDAPADLAEPPPPCSRGPRAIGQLMMALVLGVRAQRLRSMPLTALAPAMCAIRWLPHGLSLPEARCAAHRAGKILTRCGLLGNCIVRALIFASLISDREQVQLAVGFRVAETGSASGPDGHAWVDVAGRRELDHSRGKFKTATTIHFSRSPS